MPVPTIGIPVVNPFNRVSKRKPASVNEQGMSADQWPAKRKFLLSQQGVNAIQDVKAGDAEYGYTPSELEVQQQNEMLKSALKSGLGSPKTKETLQNQLGNEAVYNPEDSQEASKRALMRMISESKRGPASDIEEAVSEIPAKTSVSSEIKDDNSVPRSIFDKPIQDTAIPMDADSEEAKKQRMIEMIRQSVRNTPN